MKKVLLAMIVATAMYGQSSAQTNTFPTTGNVGIGTTTPATLLEGATLAPALTLTPTTYAGAYRSQFGARNDATGVLVFGNNGNNEIRFGNTNAGGAGGIYVNNTKDYATATDGTLAMYFHVNGNVGVGTTSPSDKFHVFGASDHQLAIDASGQYSTLDFLNAGTVKTQLYWDNAFANFNIQSTTSLLLQPGGANVGIGTQHPISLFQVDEGCTKASIGDASGSGLNYGTSYLGFNASRSGTNWLTNGDGGNNGGGVIYSSIFGDMYFSIVPTTGGSGQTLADATIANNIALKISHTDGAVYAKKIYVQLTGFPDYVFKKDYQLMPLSSVKSYIDANHHLPEMPTDKEVESKGLDVGEMNKLLTKKVEELMLYLIQQKEETEKQNKMQQQSIDELKKQVEALSKH